MQSCFSPCGLESREAQEERDTEISRRRERNEDDTEMRKGKCTVGVPSPSF